MQLMTVGEKNNSANETGRHEALCLQRQAVAHESAGESVNG